MAFYVIYQPFCLHTLTCLLKNKTMQFAPPPPNSCQFETSSSHCLWHLAPYSSGLSCLVCFDSKHVIEGMCRGDSKHTNKLWGWSTVPACSSSNTAADAPFSVLLELMWSGRVHILISFAIQTGCTVLGEQSEKALLIWIFKYFIPPWDDSHRYQRPC